MRHSLRVTAVLVTAVAGFSGAAQAQSDPPTRVGRLSFVEGTVSFHEDQEKDWSPAVVNTPLTSGDAIWTEPGARSEVSLAGTRVRLDNATQVDFLAIDDSQTRLQVDRGRIDVKTYTLDTQMPYQIVTPRGTITLQAQGDYYVEAGSIEDATRLGVRSGAAQIQSLSGQTLAVRPGEVGEISGDTAPQLRTVNSAPPPPVSYWDARDKQVNYDPPGQYLSAGVTGYEDLNAYGSWSNDSQYGNVWSPRSTPSGWQPYRTGHWSNVRPWGWTWIDDQPWGYAPYHYGRWANSNNRWVWVPPQRDVQPVYAPALVAFIGGVELAVTLGNTSDGPVGWFPLAPRETYVPAYTVDRDYYNRLNRSAQVQQSELDDRWQRTQSHELATNKAADARVNLRFATVVPANVFVRSQPVARATLAVTPEKLLTVPIAIVSTPPAPTASLAATAAPAKSADPKAQADAKTRAEAETKAKAQAGTQSGAQGNIPVAKAAATDMPTLGKPAATAPVAPGPKIATAPNTPATTGTPGAQGRPAAPSLVPRTGAAPPPLKEDKATPAPQPEHKATTAPATPAPPTSAQPAPTHPAAAVPPAAQHTPATPVPARESTQEPNKADRGATGNVPASQQAVPKSATTPAPAPAVSSPQPAAPNAGASQRETQQARPAAPAAAAAPEPKEEEKKKKIE